MVWVNDSMRTGYGTVSYHSSQARTTNKKKVMGVLDIYGFEIFEVIFLLYTENFYEGSFFLVSDEQF